MFTTIAASFVLFGAVLAGSDESINKPTCCTKNAYCCSVEHECCPKSTVTDKMVTDSAVATSDTLARLAYCAKRAYCCSVNRKCCRTKAATEVTV